MIRKRVTGAVLAVVLSASVLSSGNAGSVSQAAYKFDKSKKAVTQLENIFTTVDLMDATIDELSAEMKKGHVTSAQLVQMYIDRIHAYDKKKKLNSIISINPNAISDAKKLDKERKAGKVRGPLHGIPVIVKDNYDLKGTATTAGSLSLLDLVSQKDSFVVKKLKAAGAVVIAKANMSEFASSAVFSHSLVGGDAHNPYDITRSPAGSSGGTAVAIASNFATIGFGTDTGGSIRNPSSWCNLFGIRPSKGLTSIDGVVPLMASRDTTGPMTRTAKDLAYGLEAIAGTDSNDDFTKEADADKLRGKGYTKYLSASGLKGKRIGYLTSSFSSKVEYEDVDGQPITDYYFPDAKIEQMVRRTRADLRKAGATFVDMSDVLTDDLLYECSDGATEITIEYDINKYLHAHGDNAPFKTLKDIIENGKEGIDYDNLSTDPSDIETYASTFELTTNPYSVKTNGYMRLPSWENTLSYRQILINAMKQKNVDAIMFISEVNVPMHEDMYSEGQQYNLNQNAYYYYSQVFGPSMGCPDMVIPMGFSETDASCPKAMPLGMHVVGKFGDEKTLMQIAYAYQKQAGSDIRRIPDTSPALKDKNLNSYLDSLMNEVYMIDYSRFKKKPKGKIKLMQVAYNKAANVKKSDPNAVYSAAKNLAKAYDRVMASKKK
ncbi:MAG: amidase [Eubacterium sp.]|nr:amidase [Eubacterium sp.]